MKKIRVAQIGLNRYSHGGDIFRTMKSMPDLFEIVGIAFVEDELETCRDQLWRVEGYPELTVEEILSDPTIDAVTVETDEIHLLKYAQMVADAGKHIHMEKPGSQCLADFERLIETVKRNKTVLHIGYMYRYNNYIANAIQKARAGEFGEVFSVEAHMSRWDNDVCREWLSTFKGGMMFYLGCHLIDIVLQIQGMPERIIPLNKSTGRGGVDAEDFGFAILEYPNGISFVRMSGAEVGGNDRRQLVICGTERTVEIRPLEESMKDDPTIVAELYSKRVERSILNEKGNHESKEYVSTHIGRYNKMMQTFAALVRGEMENPYTYDYELTLFRVLLKCCGMEE